MTKLFIAAILLVAAITSFSEGNERQTEANVTVEMVNPESAPQGQQVYNRHCVSCHQQDGSGVPSMYPPLKGDKRVLGDKELLIEVTLKGMEGPVLNKNQYMGAMASYKFLSDKKIADVLTYIRTNFGNDATEVTPQEVAKVRKTLD